MSATRRDIVEAPDERTAKRAFTVAEANRSVVLVKRIVADVTREYSRLLDFQEALEAAEASGAVDQYEETHLALIRAAGRLRTCLAELDDVGVELRDWSLGVVDFRCVAGDREVCLTWQRGQESVEHWHELDSGFACLEPIETLPPAGEYIGRGAAVSAEHRAGKAAGTRLPNN